MNQKGQLDPVTKKAPFYHTFFSGILAGSIGAYLVTPLDVIKTRIQTTTKAEGEKTYKGILDCAM